MHMNNEYGIVNIVVLLWNVMTIIVCVNKRRMFVKTSVLNYPNRTFTALIEQSFP